MHFKDEYLKKVSFCGPCWHRIKRAQQQMVQSTPTIGIACDASCIEGNGTKKRDGYFHGVTEWQAVDLSTGEIVIKSGRHEQGTINTAEFLAIVGSLRYLHSLGQYTTPVYSDSKITINWVRQKETRTALPRNEFTEPVLDDLEEALHWLRKTEIENPVIWWNQHKFGTMPADFGRK